MRLGIVLQTIKERRTARGSAYPNRGDAKAGRSSALPAFLCLTRDPLIAVSVLECGS
jgi:hypothetical protein